MPHLCYEIHGQRHCFEIPMLVDLRQIHIPPPHNYPPLELAVTVIKLVEALELAGRKSDLGRKLLEVSTAFMQHVQAGLPEGVELTTKRVASAQPVG